MNHIVRKENTVLRPTGYWGPCVHELLTHLEKQGFEGAPRFLGIDDSDREIRLGMDILRQKENVTIDRIVAHGGVFKTPLVGRKMCAAALNVPVSVLPTAGEGGAWGMAILASYMLHKEQHEGLADYLAPQVFKGAAGQEVNPDSADVNGWRLSRPR